MKVVTNPYDAELGRFSGAQIQIISQNGTNQFHGTGLFKLDRPGLNARQRFDPNNNKQRDNARFNEFGGTVGGPVIHNRLFFFGYDTIRNNGTNDRRRLVRHRQPRRRVGTSGTTANKFLTVKGVQVAAKKILEGPSDGHDCASVGPHPGCELQLYTGSRPRSRKPSYDWRWKAGPFLRDPGLRSAESRHPSWSRRRWDRQLRRQYGRQCGYVLRPTEGPNNNINTQYNGRGDYQVTRRPLAGNIYYVPVHNDSFSARVASNFFHHNAPTTRWPPLQPHIHRHHVERSACDMRRVEVE